MTRGFTCFRKGNEMANGGSLSQPAIVAALGGQFPGELSVKAQVDSTQEEARRALMAGTTGPAVFIADHQLAGHGRQGRSFYSPAGTGLYLTALFPAAHLHLTPALITPVVAVMVCRVLEAQVPAAHLMIKWVNDLYLGAGKVVGILTEMVPVTGSPGAVLIGMGINLTTTDFPTPLVQWVTTLAPGAQLDRNCLAAALISALNTLVTKGPPADWLAEYRRRSLLVGRMVSLRVGKQDYPGRVVAIDDQARLVLETAEGRRTFSAGEVTKVHW